MGILGVEKLDAAASFRDGLCVLRCADCRIACADRRRVTAGDWDDYDDEDDPGYVREDIQGPGRLRGTRAGRERRGRQPARHGPLPPGHGPLSAQVRLPLACDAPKPCGHLEECLLHSCATLTTSGHMPPSQPMISPSLCKPARQENPRTTLGGSPQIILVIPGLRCKRTSPFGACEAFLCVSLLTPSHAHAAGGVGPGRG